MSTTFVSILGNEMSTHDIASVYYCTQQVQDKSLFLLLLKKQFGAFLYFNLFIL
jgi:hypothetical protein